MESEHRRIRPYPATSSAFPAERSPAGRHDWELSIHGDLSDRENDLLPKLVELPRNSRGTIFFDSCGGSAYVGLALASVIRLRGLHAIGVVAGECSSAAIMPFAACRERYVTAHATLLFHPIRWSSDEDLRMEEAAEWARHFHQLETDLDRLLVRMLDVSEQQLAEWTRPGRFVTGPELVSSGLARLVDLFSGDLWTQIAAARRGT
ncbi:MAG: ATP-dependent Clp protease proteolytic subunit [Planctomycetaceae bacterium]